MVYSAKDIHEVAPPHSYIDVRDFRSPKHLAEYLRYLDKHDDEYMSYFSWRKQFKIQKVNQTLTRVFCDVCQYLVEAKKPKIINDFTKWFFDDAQCEAFPKQF